MDATLEFKSGKDCMYTLLELDVTLARNLKEDNIARTGDQLSFDYSLIKRCHVFGQPIKAVSQ